MNLFYNKPKKVINAVREFYEGNITRFPYSVHDVQEAKIWLRDNKTSEAAITIERLKMMELLIFQKSLN